MCGIAGIVGVRDTTAVDAMTRALAHRGPDGEGVVRPEGEGFGLGARRLAIIDLSEAGSQPMTDPSGRYWIVYNGEVYNFREVRADLEARGRQFRSETDTEVVLAAFEAWGTECLARLNGMFAFAIWDRLERKLFAARDRLGIKPLYWARLGTGLLFASEIKALFASGLITPEADPAVAHNPSHYPTAPRTGFNRINKVPAAHFLTWQNDAMSLKKWWTIEPHDEDPGDDNAAEHLAMLLEDSVHRQMVSDVPIGAMLSGGLDSSTIVALMQRAAKAPVHTFSVTFQRSDRRLEAAGDDQRYARLMARKLGCTHQELEVTPDIVRLLPQLVWSLDEPIADPAAINTYLIARAAREQGVRVLLTGMGADEIFGGYRKHLACLLAERYQKLLPRVARHVLELATDRLPVASARVGFRRVRWAKRFLSFASLQPIDRFIRSDLSLPPRLYGQMFADAERYPYDGLEEVCARRESMRHQGASYLAQMGLSDTLVYLPDHNLAYTDKATMAAGVEARPPLIDHRIVELAFSLHDRYRIRGMQQKWLLRKAASRWLPPSVVRRPKSPFSAPLRAWIRRDLREMVDDLLSISSLRQRGIYQPDGVRSLIDEDRKGLSDHSQLIWTLLWREMWFRSFIESSWERNATRPPRDVGNLAGDAPKPAPVISDTSWRDTFRSGPVGKRRLLALVQLPPPIHGVSVMNQAVVDSPGLRQAFEIQILPLRFASSIADVGRPTVGKVLRSARIASRLFFLCARDRPSLAYFTLVPVGGAFYRDLMFASVLKMFRIPTVYHLHGKGVRRASHSVLHRKLYRWVFRNAMVVHLSSHLYDDIADYVARERCFILPNAVPDASVNTTGRKVVQGDRSIHIVFLSNMKIIKGPLVLLEALGALRAKGIRFRASFAGAWSEEACARRFSAMVEDLSLGDAVTYCGPVYGDEKATLLGSADVFVFPSYHPTESLPLVILEAMSYALPVIATPEGAIPDMVEDGVTGFLVEKRNASALADRLEHLMTHDDLREDMGRRGRERFLQKYTLDRFESDLCGIFEHALGSKGMSRAEGAAPTVHTS